MLERKEFINIKILILCSLIITFLYIFNRVNIRKVDKIPFNNGINNKVKIDNIKFKKKQKVQELNENNDNTNIFNKIYEVPDDENAYCKKYDPFKIIQKRFSNRPKILCKNKISSHICYINSDIHFHKQKGLICKMKNVVIDPSKWKSSGLSYLKGPIDNRTKGFPLLSKGFFNINCNLKNNLFPFNIDLYGHYINSWNYNYKSNINYEEFFPNKTVFFISRNQDSPNLFFGGSEIINALALMQYLHLEPENIQVIFLESMFLNKDPSYIFYKYLISRGGEPVHIRNLSKKFHISNAFHIPIGWDTPLNYGIVNVPNCKYPSRSYYYLNQYINKYIEIPYFRDSIKYNKKIFYYPKNVKDPNSSIYTKYLTFQWRRQYPKGRKGQKRILGNGPEIVENLAKKLPKNYLIRLVDTAKLSMIEQISIIRKTDYFLGIHGAGLFLSVFMPTTSILHEIATFKTKRTKNLILASNLSGHKSFLDKFNGKIRIINNCEYEFYDPDIVASSVLKHINESINTFN